MLFGILSALTKHTENVIIKKVKGGGSVKKKLLIVGITMSVGGSEKSFLSFAEHINYNEWDVTLLLAEKKGALLSLVPPQIKIETMPDGKIMEIDGSNAKKILLENYALKNPLRIFPLFYHSVKTAFSSGKRRVYAKQRLWLSAMKAMKPRDEEYDLAIAYWGDRTMFYVVDKVKAKRKTAWLHFDYNFPPREDALYEKYFMRCEKIVTVSKEIEKSLGKALPAVSDRIVTMENIVDAEQIKNLAALGKSYDDGYDGIRILTVGRICEQKGYDIALPALARLKNEGFAFRWYALGEKSGAYAEKIAGTAGSLGLENDFVMLGTTENPYKYIKECDVYFQPSRHEGKSIAVEEAKLLCRPIVVSDYKTANEQLCGGALGLICEISEEGMYSAMKKMLSDKELRRDFSEKLGGTGTKRDADGEVKSLLSEGGCR